MDYARKLVLLMTVDSDQSVLPRSENYQVPPLDTGQIGDRPHR